MIPTCPYCGQPANYVDSVIIYGRSYGMVYDCRPCDAYVGVHRGTDKPKGTLANKQLRTWRGRAHLAFDPAWDRVSKKGGSRYAARGQAYARLAAALGISVDECHIGMFDEARCRRAIQICREWAAQQETK